MLKSGSMYFNFTAQENQIEKLIFLLLIQDSLYTKIQRELSLNHSLLSLDHSGKGRVGGSPLLMRKWRLKLVNLPAIVCLPGKGPPPPYYWYSLIQRAKQWVHAIKHEACLIWQIQCFGCSAEGNSGRLLQVVTTCRSLSG